MQRGTLERTILLAHQIEAMSIAAVTKKGGRLLKPPDHFLKGLRPQPQPPRGDDGSAAVAAFLDRKIDRQERAAAASPHADRAAPPPKKGKPTNGRD